MRGAGLGAGHLTVNRKTMALPSKRCSLEGGLRCGKWGDLMALLGWALEKQRGGGRRSDLSKGHEETRTKGALGWWWFGRGTWPKQWENVRGLAILGQVSEGF